MILQTQEKADELAAAFNKRCADLHIIGLAKVVPLQVF